MLKNALNTWKGPNALDKRNADLEFLGLVPQTTEAAANLIQRLTGATKVYLLYYAVGLAGSERHDDVEDTLIEVEVSGPEDLLEVVQGIQDELGFHPDEAEYTHKWRSVWRGKR